jgi:hypothetical protein
MSRGKNLKEKLSPRMKRKEIMRQKREAKRRRRKNIISNEGTSIEGT